MTIRSTPSLLAGAVTLILLAGCASSPPTSSTPSAAPPAPSSPAPSPSEEPSDDVEPALTGLYLPDGEPEAIVTGLAAPWSVAPLGGGSILISERDSARIHEVTPTGEVRDIGTVDGVVPGGEGGLLGLAAHESDGEVVLFIYFTAASDNRIVRSTLTGEAGSYALGPLEEVLTGIPKARTHNGGRLLIGPDELLYATVGDAQQVDQAQNPETLPGSIVRLTLDGAIPDDNPFPDSPVYSFGHRNPQGLAFDSSGQLWAAEFGQNTWDELNRIEAGGNYGWPTVEGMGGDDRFLDPVQQWPTSEASPSGLGVIGDTLYLASLRGQRLWVVDLADPSTSTDYYVGEYGRIRDALAGSDGRLWFLTNNTDGRGDPREGDDQLFAVDVNAVDNSGG